MNHNHFNLPKYLLRRGNISAVANQLPMLGLACALFLGGCRANLPAPNGLTTRVDGAATPVVSSQSNANQLSTDAAIAQIEQQLSLLQPQNSLTLIDQQLVKSPDNRTLSTYYVLMGLANFVVNSSWNSTLKQLNIIDVSQFSKPRNAIVGSRLQLDAAAATSTVTPIAAPTIAVLDQSQIQLYLHGNLGTLVSQLLNPTTAKPDLNRPYSTAKSSNLDINKSLGDFRFQFATIYQDYFQRSIKLLDAMIAENKPISVNLSNMQLVLDQSYLTSGQLQVTDLKMLRGLLLIIQGTGFYLSAYQLDFMNNMYDRLVGLEVITKKLWQDHFGSFSKAFSTFLEPKFDVAPYLTFDTTSVAGLIGANGRPNSKEGWLSWAIVEVIQTWNEQAQSGVLLKPDLLTMAGAAFAEGFMQMSGVANDINQSKASYLGLKWLGVQDTAAAGDLLQQVAQSISQKVPANILWNQKNYTVNFSSFFDIIKQKDLRETILPATVVINNGTLSFKTGSN